MKFEKVVWDISRLKRTMQDYTCLGRTRSQLVVLHSEISR